MYSSYLDIKVRAYNSAWRDTMLAGEDEATLDCLRYQDQCWLSYHLTGKRFCLTGVYRAAVSYLALLTPLGKTTEVTSAVCPLVTCSSQGELTANHTSEHFAQHEIYRLCMPLRTSPSSAQSRQKNPCLFNHIDRCFSFACLIISSPGEKKSL